MKAWEVAAENGMRVRVRAVDEAEAFGKAVKAAPEIETAGAYLIENKPVGWDGGDPHDADR